MTISDFLGSANAQRLAAWLAGPGRGRVRMSCAFCAAPLAAAYFSAVPNGPERWRFRPWCDACERGEVRKGEGSNYGLAPSYIAALRSVCAQVSAFRQKGKP